MVRRFALCFAPLTLVALYACKDDPVHPPAAGEPANAQPFSPISGSTGVNGDSGTTVVDDGGLLVVDASTCSDLVAAGGTIDEESVALDPPTGNGGIIADGTYELTTVQHYIGATGGVAGPTGQTFKSTIRLSNGTSFERDQLVGTNTTTPSETKNAGVIVSVGVNTTVSFSCPLSTQEQYAYTATTSQLILTNLATHESFTYQLKP